MKQRGRVVVCGQISTYNNETNEGWKHAGFHILAREIHVEGFLLGFRDSSGFYETDIPAALASGEIR